MRRGKRAPEGEPKQPSDHGAATEAVGQGKRLTPEFCELVYEWDPEAANDSYYVTSADFVQLHSEIKRGLLRGVLWWAIIVCAATAAVVFVFA